MNKAYSFADIIICMNNEINLICVCLVCSWIKLNILQEVLFIWVNKAYSHSFVFMDRAYSFLRILHLIFHITLCFHVSSWIRLIYFNTPYSFGWIRLMFMDRAYSFSKIFLFPFQYFLMNESGLFTFHFVYVYERGFFIF